MDALEGLLWAALTPLEVVWVIAVAVYMVMQRRSAQATMAWIFVLAFLPLFGVLVYFFFGPRRFERRKRRRARALRTVERTTAADAGASLEVPDPATRLMSLCEAAVGLAGRPRTAEVRIFTEGRAKYAALEAAIAEATHHVHLEYYIWEPDRIGTRLRDRLCERAKAGVKVRVLVDGFGSSKAHDRFWKPLRDAGGDVRRFNALTLARWRPRMANFRTHRKIVVVDGTVGFTGGMNVTDVHTDEHTGEEAWRDTHVELRGLAVKGLQMVFFEDWLYAGGDARDIDAYLPAPGSVPAASRVCQIVSSGPDENLDAIHKLFFASIAGAGARVLLTTPYFVPDEATFHALTTAALRGADVRILVPKGGDVPLVAAAARSYYPELLEAGARIFEYGPPVLHSKTLVVDDALALVGTANFDNRSFRLNFEVVVAAYDAGTADELARAFEHDLTHAREITLAMVRGAPFHTRLAASAARLLSPIL
ncbi:MAG TPA: cardiolipin synthase [Sandaracinaceae bacterium LLY-WYZ-13_1]|nr:cardiolipin synthase [Sandaracinaceae bacterium LLY-WYZ-13_1]